MADTKQISFRLDEASIAKLTNAALEAGMNRNDFLTDLVTEALSITNSDPKCFDKPVATKPTVSNKAYDGYEMWLPKRPKLLPMTTRITGQMSVLYQMLSKADYEQTLEGVTYYFCRSAYMIYKVDGITGRSGLVKYQMIAQHVKMEELALGENINLTTEEEAICKAFMTKDIDGYHVPYTFEMLHYERRLSKVNAQA